MRYLLGIDFEKITLGDCFVLLFIFEVRNGLLYSFYFAYFYNGTAKNEGELNNARFQQELSF